MKKMKMLLLGLTMAMSLMTTGCGNKKEIVPIKPDEVAYETNNFGSDTSQKIGDDEKWKLVKGNLKMVIVKHRKESLGGFLGFMNRVSVPEKTILVVPTSVVSREWVGGTNGTSKENQSFAVDTSSGTTVILGITVGARISDTKKYINQYSVKKSNQSGYRARVEAKPLADVLDDTVRRFVVGQLSKEFSKIPTGDAQRLKSEVVGRVAKATSERFIADGIEITSFNGTGRVTWDDEEIQNAINETARFLAQKDRAEAEQVVKAKNAETKRLVREQEAMANAKETQLMAEAEKNKAEQEKLQQDEVNKMKIAEAETARKIKMEEAQGEVDVANEKAKTLDVEKQLAEIDRYKAETVAIQKGADADLIRAEAWDGVQPMSRTTVTGAKAVVDTDANVQTLQIGN